MGWGRSVSFPSPLGVSESDRESGTLGKKRGRECPLPVTRPTQVQLTGAEGRVVPLAVGETVRYRGPLAPAPRSGSGPRSRRVRPPRRHHYRPTVIRTCPVRGRGRGDHYESGVMGGQGGWCLHVRRPFVPRLRPPVPLGDGTPEVLHVVVVRRVGCDVRALEVV